MQNYKLSVEEGETVELQSPGALSFEASGRWRIGEWVKTDRRMLFLQGSHIKFFIRFDYLVNVTPCEREYSFKKKRCHKIIFNDGGDNRVFWFITSDITLWENKISEYLEDPLTEDDIARVANRLGHSAEKILWHLYRKRHAAISELTDIVGADSHMDVLNMIRKEINQTAGEVIGRSVLVFKPEGVDQNGRKITYNWWFADCKITKDSPFCDIMDEGEFYRIIIESPPDVEEELKESRLCLKNQFGFVYSTNIPSDALKTIHNRAYRNGVLELCIMKDATTPFRK